MIIIVIITIMIHRAGSKQVNHISNGLGNRIVEPVAGVSEPVIRWPLQKTRSFGERLVSRDGGVERWRGEGGKEGGGPGGGWVEGGREGGRRPSRREEGGPRTASNHSTANEYYR